MKNLKRSLALLLSLVLMLSCIPTVALAEDIPAAPLATVTELEDENYTFAVNFLNPQPTFDQQTYYNSWLAEYELSFSKPVTLGTDVTVSLRNEQMNITEWMSAPMDNALAANQAFGIMDYVFNIDRADHYTTYYGDLFLAFANVDLGVKFSDEYLAANPNVMTTVAIKLTNPETNEVVVLAEYVNGVPEYPDAKVTPIMQEGMTFAMNFLMEDPSDEQIAYYGDWFADFEITFNKDVTFDANGEGDGWLAGQYDEWSPNWVNVPIKPVTIKAGETIKIMEFAAELLGEAGLKLTYKDVYESVKDFDCGVFFDEEFLLANPDIQVDLNLKMYSPDGTESSVIGESLEFTYDPETPDRPTATVTETENDDLTFSMNFKVDDATLSQQAYYGKWYADFELTVNKAVSFNAEGGADGYLSGQYDAWSENWVNVPFGKYAPVTLEAGETLRIMEFAAKLMGEPGLKYTFQEVYDVVKDFDCGVYFEPEFLMANPDLVVTLELKMYNPADETESYVIGETYTFENNFVAYNTATEKLYTDVVTATLECGENETVKLMQDTSAMNLMVLENTTLDLNGFSLTATYVSCYGNIIDDSADNKGVLVVSAKRFLIQEDNTQLPVHDGTGYRFVEVLKFNQAMTDTTTYNFQPLFESSALELLMNGAAATGITIEVKVSWTQDQGHRSQNFVYKDELLQGFLNSYNPENGGYGKMFTLTLKGVDNIEELTFTAMVVSNSGVTRSANN